MNTDLPTPQTYTNVSSGNKVFQITLVVVFIFLSLLVIGGVYYYTKQVKNKPLQEQIGLPIIKTVESNQFTPPLKVQKKFIKNYGFSYLVEAKIKSIQKDKRPFIITTDITDATMPRIEVSTGTAMFVRRNEKNTPVNIDQFQPGNNIRIAIFYDIAKKRWRTERVVKLAGNTSTKSAVPKPSVKPK